MAKLSELISGIKEVAGNKNPDIELNGEISFTAANGSGVTIMGGAYADEANHDDACECEHCEVPAEPVMALVPEETPDVFSSMLEDTYKAMESGEVTMTDKLKAAFGIEVKNNGFLVQDLLNIEAAAAQQKFEIDMQAKAKIYKTIADYSTLAAIHRVYDTELVEMCKLVDKKNK